jgi:hypothetical protein
MRVARRRKKSQKLGLRLRRLALDILGFQAFATIDDFEVHDFTLVQGLETVTEDRCVVDENVLTRFLSDEPEAFLVVKPLDFTAGHNVSPVSYRPCSSLKNPMVRRDRWGSDATGVRSWINEAN